MLDFPDFPGGLTGEHDLPSSSLPVGSVLWFAADSPPAGWLEADGSAISRTTYADLFAEIDEAYGSGDGSTTFNLPDLRGEFVRGWDNGRGVDSGRGLGSGQAADLESHTHGFPSKWGVETGTATSGIQTGTISNSGTPSVTATGGDETRPRNVALLPIIKY